MNSIYKKKYLKYKNKYLSVKNIVSHVAGAVVEPKQFDNETLKTAVALWFDNNEEAIRQYGHISQWDVSRVTNMAFMFSNTGSFDQAFDRWNISNVRDMHEMFKNSELSTENYDATLTGWSQLTLQRNIRLNAGESQYCISESARQSIIDNFNWDILDDGKNCQ